MCDAVQRCYVSQRRRMASMERLMPFFYVVHSCDRFFGNRGGYRSCKWTYEWQKRPPGRSCWQPRIRQDAWWPARDYFSGPNLSKL